LPGGYISGYIKTESGEVMPDVKLEVKSQSIQFVKAGLTEP